MGGCACVLVSYLPDSAGRSAHWKVRERLTDGPRACACHHDDALAKSAYWHLDGNVTIVVDEGSDHAELAPLATLLAAEIAAATGITVRVLFFTLNSLNFSNFLLVPLTIPMCAPAAALVKGGDREGPRLLDTAAFESDLVNNKYPLLGSAF